MGRADCRKRALLRQLQQMALQQNQSLLQGRKQILLALVTRPSLQIPVMAAMLCLSRTELMLALRMLLLLMLVLLELVLMLALRMLLLMMLVEHRLPPSQLLTSPSLPVQNRL